MSTPHYIASRVGDEYVLVRVDEPEAVVTAPRLLLFGATATGVAAVLARGRTGLALAGVAGGLLAWWGVGVARGGRVGSHGKRVGNSAGPSFAKDFEAARGGIANQRPQDAVDEASMESFPASDPPAHTTPTNAAG